MAFAIHVADAFVRVVFDKGDFQRGLDDLQKSFDGLQQKAQAALVPFGAMTAAGTALIGKVTMTAARTEELGVVIQNMGRVADYAEGELADTEEGIKKLGITTQASREMMARLMGAHLDLADATKIARAAQDLAVIGMKDSSEAAADLTYAIVSMRPVLLKKYGLYVNLNDVYEQAAEALGKEATALTESEKRLAYKNAVLQAAAAYTGTYEAAMETAGKQIRSFDRFIQEASNVLGEYFLPYLTEGVEVATDFMKGFLGAGEEVHRNTARLIAYGTVVAGANTAVIALVLSLKTMTAVLGWMTGPVGLLATALGLLVVKGLEVRQEFRKLEEQAYETARSAEEYADAMQEIRARHDDLIADGEFVTKAFLEMQREQQRTADMAEYEKRKLDDLRQTMREMGKDWPEDVLDHGRRQLEEIGDEAEDLGMTLREVLGELGGAWYGHINDIRDAMSAYRELENKVISVGANTAAQTQRHTTAMARMEEDHLEKRSELLEKHAEKWAWVRSGHHARTKEEIAEVEAYWAQKLGEEVAEFDAAYEKKRSRKEEDYRHSIAVANAAAAERARIAEEERQRELAEMRAAQEERILLAALEMLEVKELLKLPWVEASVTAEEYYEAVKTGLVPVSTDIKKELGGALEFIEHSMARAQAQQKTGFEVLQGVLQGVIPDVMNVGTAMSESMAEPKDKLETMVAGFREIGLVAGEQSEEVGSGLRDNVAVAVDNISDRIGWLMGDVEGMKAEWTRTTDGVRTGIGFVEGALDDTRKAVSDLGNEWIPTWRRMRRKVEDTTEEVEDFIQELKDIPRRIDVTIRVRYETVGGIPTGLQHGFHGIVTGPMPVVIGEAGP